MTTAQEVVRRISILLRVLESAIAQSLLDELPPAASAPIRQHLELLESYPPDDEEVDEVLGELDRTMRLLDQIRVQRAHSDRAAAPRRRLGGSAARGVSATMANSGIDLSGDVHFEPSDDPLIDLQRLHPLRLAGALRSETPRAIATVLRGMDPARAGAVLGWLNEDTRTDVFLQMNAQHKPNLQLTRTLAAAAVRTALNLDMEDLLSEQEKNEAKIARLLRTVSRQDRIRVLEALDDADADAADRIREELYSFDDLLLADDRSLQRIMAEIDAATLGTALKQASDSIRDRVLSNMSKRARETLLEEMEFMGGLSDDDFANAQKRVVQAMLQLDEKGDLVLQDSQGN